MGWKCTIVVVRDADLADLAVLEPLCWSATAETAAWDEVTDPPFDGVAGWERDGDLVLVSGGGGDLIDAIPALGALGAAYGGIFQSTVDLYLWEVAGDAGRRSWHWSQGELTLDEGPPHPAEAGIERLDEDALFSLLEAGGFVYDERLEDASFVVLDTGPSYDEPPAPRAPRRKRFGIF